jgi:hypothetical protein
MASRPDHGTSPAPQPVLSNAEIADRLASLAQLLSSQKENPYKVKAYQRAAARIRNLSESLDEMVRDQEDLTFAGIGEAIASAIEEIVTTGTLGKPAVASITSHPRLDPTRVMRVYKNWVSPRWMSYGNGSKAARLKSFSAPVWRSTSGKVSPRRMRCCSRVRTTTRISIRITKRKCLWSSLRCKPDSSCIGNLYRRMELCVASSQRTIHRSFLAKQESERFRKRAQSVSGQPATALR